jgi:hypothetical protein
MIEIMNSQSFLQLDTISIANNQVHQFIYLLIVENQA